MQDRPIAMQSAVLFLITSFALILTTSAADVAGAASEASGKVSFYSQIRPIFQANCQGCHQPAKAKGGYVMTDFERLLLPGESGEKPVVAGKPEASFLLTQIVPVNGEAEMPRGKAPLPEVEIDLVRRWIAQGAVNDTPAGTRMQYDMEHPPVYLRLPVVTALEYSPDGKLIAVAGFNEVILHHSDGSGIVGRLVGMSDRLQSLRFSPDGSMLAVAGGQPARMGEVQIWDVEKRKLSVSVPVGYDTVYGVDWSPDGTLVSFGCPDNTVRAIEAKTGKQVLQQGSHNDWVLDTVFSTNGSHIISVGRDMSAKLTETATQRFVDNITSITPGALRGGLQSVARHPTRDEILVGGADGVPQIYRVFRETDRKIGDNANLIRRFPGMEGRVFGVDYSEDGNRIVAGASLDARGAVNIYSAAFDSTISTNLAKILEKTVDSQSAEEKAEVEKYVTADVKLEKSVTFSDVSIYTVGFSPDGKRVAAAGSDGRIRLIDPETGEIVTEFASAPLAEKAGGAGAEDSSAGGRLTDVKPADGRSGTAQAEIDAAAGETLPEGVQVVGLKVEPGEIRIHRRNEYAQLMVMATLGSGGVVDVTRMASYGVDQPLGEVSSRGRFTATSNGTGVLTIRFRGASAELPVVIEGVVPKFDADFVRDLSPVLSKAGCTAGTCHGARNGKNGFKLSLRGYDPIYDVRGFADDHAARRVNLASPDDSLMLLKAVGEVPHEGGQRMTRDSEYYAILRRWIADGTRLNTESARVSGIRIYPENPVVQATGSRQQMRVVATYSNGYSRDVTSEAFISSGNGDVVAVDDWGLITTLRRGEAPVLARFEGAYTATTLTVMGDRSGFVWEDQPANNRIDELVAAKWKRMKILPSGLCTDSDFIRRVYLDLVGLPPSPSDLRGFLDDPRDSQIKRDLLIEQLMASPDFVDHWSSKWADLLQVNRKFLGVEGARLFREWIRMEIRDNTPYDQFVRKILTATGSNRENPAASYFKVLRQPEETMENTTHLFLGTRFNCNKCHDHPFERWTQDQYYSMSAFFARVDFEKDPESGDRRIGGTAVENAKPLFEKVVDRGEGEVTHLRTGKVASPEFPYAAGKSSRTEGETRREELVEWMTSPDNRYFALSYMNRLWGYLMGVGLIEPLDDIRAGNPPSNPDLLNYLTQEFIETGFDTRAILRLICQSRAYQLSVGTHRWNEDDTINYSHATARRLPAEVLLDAVYRATGSTPNFPGVPAGTRAAQLMDSAIDLPSGFLANLGRPPRESACECERSNDMQLGSVMSLLSGPAVSGAVNDPANELARLASSELGDRELIQEVFLRVLSRSAKEEEIEAAQSVLSGMRAGHEALSAELEKAEPAWNITLEKREAERQAAIGKAERALGEYLAEQAPQMASLERKRQERIAEAQRELMQLQPLLPAKMDEWEKDLGDEHHATRWQALAIKEVQGTGSARLEKLADGSVRASEISGGLPDYIIEAETSMRTITGIKLEVLTDDSLPSFGPGWKDGGFVLSEFVVDAGSKTNASELAKAVIREGVADFIAEKYELKQLFDGKAENGKAEGWSIGAETGRPHWVAFTFETPIRQEAGTALRIRLQHHFQGGKSIGRFRLWVTGSGRVTGEGLPADVAGALNTAGPLRTPAQVDTLMAHYRTVDAELRKREQAVFLAGAPVPEDAKRKELETLLAKAARPVPTDAALVQLRQDVQASAGQLKHPRLTVAQDLAWALINMPSFLFNR